MVMEFIDGRTLAQLIKGIKKPFRVDRVLMWAEQLCDALHYLHNQTPSIIYRDLKPGNIMVIEQTNHIKLIDFGIARFYKQGKVKDTITFGTHGYAPPEQYGSRQTDARADIYALGATLHELLTLQDPAQLIIAYKKVRTMNARVSPKIANAIEKAVQQDRRNRHQSIIEFWKAMSGKPARWTNPTHNTLIKKWKQ
jgi:serine/threonine-protein kinase